VLARALDFDLRRVRRHHDRRGHLEPARSERDRLSVIARRERDDAGRALLGAELEQPIQRAADLEAARVLEALGFEQDARSARARHLSIDAFYAPCSGGGLVGGCALALKAEWPSCAVYAVEPKGFEDHAASLEAGERRAVPPGGTTLCDGLRAPMPGAITFAINKRELAGARAVDDAQIRAAMALAAQHLKVVVEPSGAAALAAVLAEPRPIGPCIAVVLSGGNVDAELLAEVLRTR